MPNNKFAYLASPELDSALRDLSKRVRVFHDEVIHPWEESNPEVKSVWNTHHGFDPECVGFAVVHDGDPVPAGLSSNRARDWLIPRRGWTGNEWRGALDHLNKRPKIGPVLREFCVEHSFLVPDHARIYHLGLRATPSAYYLTWGHEHPDPGPHLTPVLLSEYYLAIETADKEVSTP
jgi:hypothetical protein